MTRQTGCLLTSAVGMTLLGAALWWFFAVKLNDFEDPLLNASYAGSAAKVERLLDDGADPNRRGPRHHHTPLTLAPYRENADVIALLLDRGADVNLQNGTGATPLHVATHAGQVECARILLEHGADQSITNKYGQTPVFNAATKGPPAMAALLLKHPVDLAVRDVRGWQPLHAALRSNRLKESPEARFMIVRMLLGHGADPNFLNAGGWEEDSRHDSHIGRRAPGNPNRGNTPLAIARSNGFTNIVELLKSKGARE